MSDTTVYKFAEVYDDGSLGLIHNVGYVIITNEPDGTNKIDWKQTNSGLRDVCGNVLHIHTSVDDDVVLPFSAKLVGRDDKGVYYYIPTREPILIGKTEYEFVANDISSMEGDNLRVVRELL